MLNRLISPRLFQAINNMRHSPEGCGVKSVACVSMVLFLMFAIASCGFHEAHNAESATNLLLHASEGNDYRSMKTAISKGAEVNARHQVSDLRPLDFAAINENSRAVEFLLSVGAEVESHGTAPPAIWHAARKGNFEIVAMLLESGASPNASAHDGFTTLMAAVDSGESDVVELVLQAGAEVDRVDRRGLTAKDIASNKGNEDIIAILRQWMK